MIQECCVCGFRYGEKEPFEDKSVTHGFCPSCLKKELKKLEEFKKTGKRGMINMPKERKPKVGDFVLWDDDIWVIESIKGKRATIALLGKHGYEDEDEILVSSLEETDIRTWEFS